MSFQQHGWGIHIGSYGHAGVTPGALPKRAVRLDELITVTGLPCRSGHGRFGEVTVRLIRIPRLPLAAVIAVTAIAAATGLTACSGPAPSRPAAIKAPANAPPATFYLALGDSLARGVPPHAG